jgi:hypothetical protein
LLVVSETLKSRHPKGYSYSETHLNWSSLLTSPTVVILFVALHSFLSSANMKVAIISALVAAAYAQQDERLDLDKGKSRDEIGRM